MICKKFVLKKGFSLKLCKIPKKTSVDSSVIGQRGESQNGDNKKAKHAKFSYPVIRTWYIFTRTCVSRGKKCLLFGKFDVLSFLATSVLRFAILPFYRQIIILVINIPHLKQDLISDNGDLGICYFRVLEHARACLNTPN